MWDNDFVCFEFQSGVDSRSLLGSVDPGSTVHSHDCADPTLGGTFGISHFSLPALILCIYRIGAAYLCMVFKLFRS